MASSASVTEGKNEAPPEARRFRPELFLWLPALMTLLIYLPTLNHGTVTDDRALIVENPYLTSLSGIRDLWTDDLWEASAMHLPAQYYRPLPMTLFWLQVMLLGPKLWWLRLGNVLIHAATAALLPRLLSRTNPKLGIHLASLLALVWALHPLNSEIVIWLSGRFDGLVVFLSVLTLFCNFHPRRAVFFPVLLTLALLTKEVAIALFPAVVLSDIVEHRGIRAGFFSEGKKWFVGLLVIGFYLMLRRLLGVYGASDLIFGISPTVFLSGLADLTITYTRLVFLPLDLDVFHWYTPRPVGIGLAILLAHLTIFGVACVAAWKFKNGALLAGSVLAFSSLVLASNVGPSQHVFGDRFWSLTGIAMILVLAALFEKLALNSRWALFSLVGASAIFAWFTHNRGAEWESEESLADAALARNPNHPQWLLILSHHLLRDGNIDAARKTLEHLIEIEPKMAKAYNASCVVELRGKNLEVAERVCRNATRLSPDSPSIWLNLASVYVNAHKYADTRDAAEKALSLQPKNVEAEYLFAIAQANLGAFDDAQKHINQGLALTPNHAGLLKLKAQLAARTPEP